MKRWIEMAVGLLALCCAGCDQRNPSQQSGQPAEQIARAAVPDRPIDNIFPDASEVRLFVNDAYDDEGEALFSKPAGLPLAPAQRAKLESLIAVHTFGPNDDRTADACFIPHHFFRYYDNEGEVIGEIQVCFCCEGVAISGVPKLAEDQAWASDYKMLKAFVQSLGEPTDIQC